MKNKKTLTILLAISLLILLSPIAKANYQMTPKGSKAKARLYDIIPLVRIMEADGQVMGLSEELDSTTLKPTTPENGIDVHLQKNTEYGACLLLSASPKYGKQGAGKDSYIHTSTSTGIATTTGNQYGVYEMGADYEWTAGGGDNWSAYGVDPKKVYGNYYNIYTSQIPKNGDATIETAKWKDSRYAGFATGPNVFGRGYSGAFSYSNFSNSNGIAGRAVAVCGLRRRTIMWF